MVYAVDKKMKLNNCATVVRVALPRSTRCTITIHTALCENIRHFDKKEGLCRRFYEKRLTEQKRNGKSFRLAESLLMLTSGARYEVIL